VKRLTAALLVTALVIIAVAGTVWAAAGPPAGAGTSKLESFRQAWEQVKARLQIMRQNRETANEFRGQAVQIAAQIRAEIKRIRDGGLPLQEEQHARIRAAVATMKGYGQSIKDTLGEIREACIQAREARRNSEGGPVVGAYSRAEAVQEARLTHLQNLVNTLNDILTELQAIK